MKQNYIKFWKGNMKNWNKYQFEKVHVICLMSALQARNNNCIESKPFGNCSKSCKIFENNTLADLLKAVPGYMRKKDIIQNWENSAATHWPTYHTFVYTKMWYIQWKDNSSKLQKAIIFTLWDCFESFQKVPTYLTYLHSWWHNGDSLN